MCNGNRSFLCETGKSGTVVGSSEVLTLYAILKVCEKQNQIHTRYAYTLYLWAFEISSCVCVTGLEYLCSFSFLELRNLLPNWQAITNGAQMVHSCQKHCKETGHRISDPISSSRSHMQFKLRPFFFSSECRAWAENIKAALSFGRELHAWNWNSQ